MTNKLKKGGSNGPGGGKKEGMVINTDKYIPWSVYMSSTDQLDFIGTILQPGSSLNPVFLRILDGAFVALLLVFVMLAFVTSGNLHIFALMFIELGLWASVKW